MRTEHLSGSTRFAVHNRDTGRPLAESVEVAATRLRRAVGLLGRAGLDPGHGLWIVPSRGVHTWGMRFPIDIAVLDREGVVVDLVGHLGPWRIRLPRNGGVGVLELRAGALEASGTKIGDRIAFETVES